MQHRVGRMDPQLARSLGRTQNCRPLAQPLCISANSSVCRLRYEIRANQIVNGRIALGLDAFQQVAPPGLKVIDPTLHLESIAAQLRNPERRFPPVVHQRLHRNLGPLIRTLTMRQQRSCNRVMAVRKDVGLNANLVAHGPFGGKPATIHLRRDSFNNDAFASIRSDLSSWLYHVLQDSLCFVLLKSFNRSRSIFVAHHFVLLLLDQALDKGQLSDARSPSN